MRQGTVSSLLAAVALGVSASAASAGFSTAIEVTAEFEQNGSTITATLPLDLATHFTPDGTDANGVNWFRLNNQMFFVEGVDASQYASLENFRVGIRSDADTEVRNGNPVNPSVLASFNVSAGIVNTTFTVNSTVVNFGPLTDVLGVASAQIGLTNSLAGNTNVVLNGLVAGSGGAAFRASYNGSTAFANLLTGPFSFPGSQSISAASAGTFDNPIYTPIAGSISSIQSQFRFSLSAFDGASGTSTFAIQVPAPSSAAVLVLAGLASARRRRS